MDSLLYHWILKSICAGLLVFSFSLPVVVTADDHGLVRIYRLNSKDQPIRMRRIGDPSEPGCHDFRGTRKAQRFAQTGFAWCKVYTGDSCEAGTEVPAMWGGKNYRVADIDISEPQIELLRGSQWLLDPEKNIQIGSFYCEY